MTARRFFPSLRSFFTPEAPPYYALLVTLLLMFGFVFGDVTFAKVGIPLGIGGPNGQIPFFQFKLFLTEIYILFLAAFVALTTSHRKPLSKPEKLTQLGLVFFTLAALRAAWDAYENPILSLRNSAFVWYLIVPILFQHLAVTAVSIERCFVMLTITTGAITLGTGILSLFSLETQVIWFAQLGLCAITGYALHSTGKLFPWLLTLAIGVSTGISFFQKSQRTSLVGILAVIVVSILLERQNWRRILIRTTSIAISSALVFNIAFFLLRKEQTSTSAHSQIASSLTKAESNASGLENFRRYMWQDAWNLFLENPLFGVGFNRQVVYRIYDGGGAFWPNDGTWKPTYGQPPISGPHNSYLNALARLGLIGILFLGLHAWAFIRLYQSGFQFAAWTLFAQGVYGTFNVGFEGPTRSFLALVAIGLAMKLGYDHPIMRRIDSV